MTLLRRAFGLALLCLSAFVASPQVHGQDGPPPRSVSGDAADVPVVWRGPQPAVDVMVSGKGPYRFAIDTGAGGDARADSSLVKTLTLETIGESRASAGPGSPVQVLPVVLMPSVTLGGITWKNLTAPSRDYNATGTLPHIDGILAMQAFSELLLTIDYPKSRFRVERGGLTAGAPGVIDADFSRRIPQITIDVAGHSISAVIDSGNATDEPLSLPASMASTLPLVAPPVPAGAISTVSGRSTTTKAELNGTLTVAGIAVSHPMVLFIDGAPSANLGSGFLKSLVLTVDQKNRRVRLTK